MKKKVLVNILGTQLNDIGETDTMQMFTEGLLFIRPDSYYIVYNESAISGMEGTTTSLKVEADRVVINRMGTTEFKQTFQEGHMDEGLYTTPHGSLYLRVIPSKVDVDFGEAGGSIHLEYELQIDQQKISDNSLQITVKEETYS